MLNFICRCLIATVILILKYVANSDHLSNTTDTWGTLDTRYIVRSLTNVHEPPYYNNTLLTFTFSGCVRENWVSSARSLIIVVLARPAPSTSTSPHAVYSACDPWYHTLLRWPLNRRSVASTFLPGGFQPRTQSILAIHSASCFSKNMFWSQKSWYTSLYLFMFPKTANRDCSSSNSSDTG